MKVYVLIVDNRHTDIQVELFSTEDKARQAADVYLENETRVERQVLNDSMTNDGWIFYATYSTEGDYVCIVVREINAD